MQKLVGPLEDDFLGAPRDATRSSLRDAQPVGLTGRGIVDLVVFFGGTWALKITLL